jgi:hypothetical protein
MKPCSGGADVMERPCAVAQGIDINTTCSHTYPRVFSRYRPQICAYIMVA